MALDKNILAKRLSYIKYLYQQGVEQSKLPEVIAGYSVLQFHDSIEMFLLLVASNLDKKNYSNWKFIEYWTNIDSLTMRSEMDELKQRRVNLKHHGAFPAHNDIEECRINVGRFLRENTKKQFDIDFDDISLAVLISYTSARTLVQDAEKLLKKNDLYNCIINTRCAFDSLLDDYEDTKKHWCHSILEIGKKQYDLYKDFVKNASSKNTYTKNTKWFKEMTQTINELRNVAKITSIGIDYKKYVLFNTITPRITKFMDGDMNIESQDSINRRINLSEDLCSFCINFVIDSAVKLQESDYDLSKFLKCES